MHRPLGRVPVLTSSEVGPEHREGALHRALDQFVAFLHVPQSGILSKLKAVLNEEGKGARSCFLMLSFFVMRENFRICV